MSASTQNKTNAALVKKMVNVVGKSGSTKVDTSAKKILNCKAIQR